MSMDLSTVTAQVVYVNGVQQSGTPLPVLVITQATTDANGNATIDLTDDAGEAIFAEIWSIDATCIVDAGTLNQNWPFATVRAIASDRKSVTIRTTHGVSQGILLGGTVVSLTPAPNTPVHVKITGR